jgi:hypothetical protein
MDRNEVSLRTEIFSLVGERLDLECVTKRPHKVIQWNSHEDKDNGTSTTRSLYGHFVVTTVSNL